MRTYILSFLFVIVSLTFLQSQAAFAIDTKLLNEAKLQTSWQSAIALNPDEKVQRVTLLGDNIYILTDNNYLFCLNRNDGTPVFSISAAEKSLPVSEPVDFNNIVYFIAGNKLVAINLTSGEELYRKKLDYPLQARPAVNAQHYYFPGLDTLLHVTNRDLLQVFKINSDDRSHITSVVSNEDQIVFATFKGGVFAMDANQPIRRWQFNTVGAIEAPLTKTEDAIYVSGKDTNLYKLNAEKGELDWKFYTGCFLSTPARVTKTTVYQYAPNKGLYAIDPNSGKQTWLLPDGIELLAENNGTAYVFDKKNVCVVMDNANAEKIYTINFAQVTAYTANTQDAKLYIMEGKNIICIEPMQK
ncbi:MAG: hypothetical protein A2Y10_08950 [Planctomycetes bacterium GWF2_41_51]|nr:MAG: hypothetical protein A2Y10_08950 [Planctomycetes bacterium GWF2_41_51]